MVSWCFCNDGGRSVDDRDCCIVCEGEKVKVIVAMAAQVGCSDEIPLNSEENTIVYRRHLVRCFVNDD